MKTKTRLGIDMQKQLHTLLQTQHCKCNDFTSVPVHTHKQRRANTTHLRVGKHKQL